MKDQIRYMKSHLWLREDLADIRQKDKKEESIAIDKQEDRKEDAEMKYPFAIKETYYSSISRLLRITA